VPDCQNILGKRQWVIRASVRSHRHPRRHCRTDEFEAGDGNVGALKRSLQRMEDVFRKLGDLSSWAELMDEIDLCFVRN